MRTRHGSGNTHSAAASKPAACAQTGATPTDHTTAGHAAIQPSTLPSADTTHAPADHSTGTAQPSNANGVMSNVTSGIAIRLAANPTNDTC